MVSFLARSAFSGAIILCLTAAGSTACAQMNSHWQIAGRFKSAVAPYFVNDSVGFAFNSWLQGTSNKLYKTMDGGKTWKELSFTATVIQMYFENPLHGFLATVSDGLSISDVGGIFETEDGGYSWRRISPATETWFSGVYYWNGIVYALSSAARTSMWYTTDDGNTWSSMLMPLDKVTDKVYTLSGNNVGGVVGTDVGGPSIGTLYTTNGSDPSGWQFGTGRTRGAFMSCAIPHTLDYFCADEEHISTSVWGAPPGHIEHSTDGGATWSLLSSPIISAGGLTGAIVYAGCGAIYAQRADEFVPDSGLIRSTDQGVTWTNVGGPPGFYDYCSISAVGTGATVYAMDRHNQIWKTTDGGDGALSANYWPSLSVSVPKQPDTLHTQLCHSVSVPFTVMNGGCLRVFLDSAAIYPDTLGSDTIAACSTMFDSTYIGDGQPSNTESIVISPRLVGTHTFLLHARIRREDWLVMDTAFPVTLDVKPNPGTLELPISRNYDFGTQDLCNPVTVKDSFSLNAHGCEPVRVDSMVFHPDSARFTDFSFHSVSDFLLPKDSIIYIPISFKPSMSDTERGSLIISWNDGENQHRDTLRVQGAGVQDTRSFSIQPPSVTVRMCDSTNGTIYFTNTTCGYLELDSLTLPAGLRLPLATNGAPQLPLELQAGALDSLRVAVVPGTEGRTGSADLRIGDTVLQVPAHLKYADKGDTTSFDTTIAISIHVERGTPDLLLSDTALDLGTFSRCNAAGDTVVTFTNTGCDSLALSGASVAAGSGFTLLLGSDTVLGPGESARYTIGFGDTTAGELTSALHLRAIGAHGGNTIDTSVPLRAMVVAGSRLAALNTQSIDVGTTSICEERDSSITITNTGCEPDTITAISFANATFSFVGPLPIIIPPHSDTTISIATAIDTTGHATTNTDTLEVTGNLDAPLLPVILSRGIEYPGRFSLAISAPDSAPVRATVPVYVLRKGTVPSQATELDFSLIYNDDLLGYLQPVQPDISSIASTLLPSGLMERSFAMKPASDRDTIATIQFQSYLTRNDVTPITLTGQNFQVAGPTPAACIASLDTGAVGQNFTLELACGYGPMINTLEDVPFRITSIESGANLLTFTVASSNPCYSSCEAQLLNILGTIEQTTHLTASQIISASFDIHALPAGAYFLRISAGDYTVEKPVMVLK